MYKYLCDNMTHYDISRSDTMTLLYTKQNNTYKNETKY